MKTTRILAIALPAALFGAGIVLCWQQVHQPNGHGPGGNPVKQEFIPAQELTILTTPSGFPLGRLDVSGGLVTLCLYIGFGIFRDANQGIERQSISASVYSDSSRVYVRYVGEDETAGGSVETRIIVGQNRTDISDIKRGYVFGEWKDLSKWDRLRNLLFPSNGKRFDDQSILPTEDLHLQDREGWTFASLGAAKNGDPGLAIADANHAVRMAWFQRSPWFQGYQGEAIDGRKYLNDSAWWDIAVFDKSGDMRLSLQLRAGKAPDLILYGDNLAKPYVLDFATHKIVPRDSTHSSSLGWLPAMWPLSDERICLWDNRGHVLWSAP